MTGSSAPLSPWGSWKDFSSERQRHCLPSWLLYLYGQAFQVNLPEMVTPRYLPVLATTRSCPWIMSMDGVGGLDGLLQDRFVSFVQFLCY